MIMKKLLLVGTLATSILLPATVPAQSFSIEIGDQPYYRHGPRYWSGDYEMVWVPGHRSEHHWVHGHYIRGEHRRSHSDRHHDRHDRSEDRRDDRGDDRHDDRH
jgi:hypothetical protein